MAARNWLATLWPASYNGFPFQFESDRETGGRAVIVHEFPHRDDPFNEDLGQAPRYFEGAAYLASDTADSDAVSFIELLCTEGPGTLVVPTRGPVAVRCLTVNRAAQRDQAGYIAFSVKFVREGAATGMVSLGFAGQGVFTAADAVAVAAATAFPAWLAVGAAQPQYAIEAAVTEFQTAVATFDVARTSYTVDPVVSAQVRDANTALVAAAPVLIGANVPAAAVTAATAALAAVVPRFPGSFAGNPPAVLAASLIAVARALADGMHVEAADGAMLAVAQGFAPIGAAPSYLSPGAQTAAENISAVNDLARLAAMIAWGEALKRHPYPSRPAGVAARAYAADYFDLEMNSASEYGAQGAALYVSVQNLRGAVIGYLTQLINNLAPVVTVTAGESMPALWWAWRLYADVTREPDLVARNGVPDPLHMPVSFAALAPGYAAPASLPVTWPAP